MKVIVSALAVLTVFTVSTAAQQFFGRVQGPDSLILQGPGSDIRATVSVLPENRRPQGANGVVIDQVTRGGPADNAGLRRGDIVTEFDAISITDPTQFGKVVRDTPPGRPVKMIVWRDGVRREVSISPVPSRPQ
jgi:S1-C subfamily serine protease